jgi:hypothetical protein
MRKLNLEKLKLAAEDVLQRNQMGTIYGGSGGSCSVCYLYSDPNKTILETLSSAGSCEAGTICYNTPGCFTWECV